MLFFYVITFVILASINNNNDFKRKFLIYEGIDSTEQEDNIVDRLRKEAMNIISDSILIALEKALEKANNTEEKNELEECKNIYQIFNRTNQSEEEKRIKNFYIYLLYYDTSKSKNDLSQYLDCVESQSFDLHELVLSEQQRKNFLEDSTYIVFKIKENNNKTIKDFTFKDNEYLFGLCIKKGCSENALKKMFVELNQVVVFFEDLEENNFEIFDLKKNNENNKIWLITIIIFSIIALLNPLNFLFKYLRINHKEKLIQFMNCFDSINNSKEILGKEQNDDSSNLNLIKGVRGLTLISIYLSCTFFYIYHLPTKVINEIYLKSLLKSNAFPLIYYGARFGKKILYALSGLELACKMIHYLDEILKKNNYKYVNVEKQISKIKDDNYLIEEKKQDNEIIRGFNNIKNNDSINTEKEDEEEGEEEEKNYLNNNYMNFFGKKEDFFLMNDKKEGNNNIDQNDILAKKTNSSNLSEIGNVFSSDISEGNFYEVNRKNLTKKFLINWYIRQFYKYLLFVLILIFYKYGNIYIFYTPTNIRPIMVLYINEIANKFSVLQILANLFCFSPFSYDTFNWIDPFEIVYNEITFFIFGSILIYVCYKYCWRLDIIILVLFLLFSTLKIILGIFIFLPNEYYPTMFYQYDGNKEIRSYISSNQFMNINIFLLGMFFGEIHYCIYYEQSKDQNKKYIILSQKLKMFFRKFFLKQKLIYTIIFHFFLFLFIAVHIVIVYVYEIVIQKLMEKETNNDLYNFFTNKAFNIISLFDSDIGVIVLLFILLMLFFHRDKSFSKLLEHKYWRILSVPYWMNILLLHIISSVIFYLSEKRIKLVIYSIIFRSFQVLLLLVLVSCFFFVLIEMPLKNLTKKFFQII